ncbi:MAG: 50S ribosomal protein L17 [bacterium]|nr:50S ribosomal protein L17 [bacterium]MDZ4285920.1 50S ribosomal protein L17 [Candidatus Sungbacteria bacterium]
MKHQGKGRIFGRKSGQRRALMKSLASSFFSLGKIKTTQAKAKEARPQIEKWITRGKNPTLANRRILAATFSDAVVKHIIVHGETYANRPGGYTRITKLVRRPGDGAEMAIIELVK